MKKELIAEKEPKSPISEIFRTLRTNIQFMSNSRKLKTILVTSTSPSEGKSWVTSNLAVTFAQAGKRVILIDADMRKGRLYTIFGVSPKPGLSNLLAEIDEEGNVQEQILDYVQQTDIENLYLITAGSVPPNPSELLVSSQMSTTLEGLKQICDIVIIDGTPCDLVTDSIILSRVVDTTIIVTAYRQTKKDSLQRVIRNIKNVGGRVAGVVLNKVPVSVKKYEESYYYGKNKHISNFSRNNAEISRKENASTVRREENRSERIQNDEVEEIPKSLRTSNVPDSSENTKKGNTSKSTTKSDDILNQINQYLENEKKDL